ncbi:unnamed protein product [Durusdinium trenchii]|uniref:Uncharacterized protein n=1 Tax=Durusdinium trenchii TaxID=1381693 RepID=A0ABP0JVL1_9DINO
MKSDICAGSEELSGGPGPHSAHWDDAWVTPRSCGGQALNPNAAPDADGLETVAPTARTQLLPKVEDVELAEDPVEEVKEASAPWGRFMMLWFCCTLASGILPGQALFAKQFADAGVFSSTCNKDEDTCKDQYLALTGIFSVGQSLAYGFSAPIGLLYDRYGAMVVGTWGALICAVGLLFVTTSVWGGSNGMDAATSWLFILGVFTCDFGSMLNSFSFMGLIWHFPGRQTVVIALINATYQASALLPLLLQAGMDQWHAPLAPFMFCWTVVVFITIYGCYRLIPTQKEYYEQAKKILGLPLPRAPTDMKVCEMLKRAMEVLQQKKEEHIFSGIALAIGFALPGYYASMTAPYGEALFGHKSDGQKLAELNVLCTSVVGLALAPFSGTIGDIFGLEVIIMLFCAIMGVCTITMPMASWPAQAICGGAMALFISLFTIFISRYLLMYSPPNRYGAVQGMYTLGVICIATPWSMGGLAATAVLPPGLNAYLIPMMTFGVSGVVGLLLYGAYFRANPPPAVPPLLPEDEAELAKSFGCGTLEQVMEITSLNRTDLLKKMSSTDPQVIQSLMKSIDTEKMMEVMSRRSVDDIADMMETAEDDEDEAADAPETPSSPVERLGRWSC